MKFGIAVIQPGSFFSLLIKLVTGEKPVAGCSCRDRSKQMDNWGWRGCWTNRNMVIQWLGQEATKRGHRIGSRPVLSLGLAAVIESCCRIPRVFRATYRRWIYALAPDHGRVSSNRAASDASGVFSRRAFLGRLAAGSAVVFVTPVRTLAGVLDDRPLVKYVRITACKSSGNVKYIPCILSTDREVGEVLSVATDCYRVGDRVYEDIDPEPGEVASFIQWSDSKLCSVCTGDDDDDDDDGGGGGGGDRKPPPEGYVYSVTPCDGGETVYTKSELNKSMTYRARGKCYTVGSFVPEEEADGVRSFGGQEYDDCPTCQGDKSCKGVWESRWNCDSSSWGPVEEITNNECDYCEDTDGWEPGRCEDGEIVYQWISCGADCSDTSTCTQILTAPTGPPTSVPPEATEVCQKRCTRTWESAWDCDTESWGTPTEVGSASCDYCCQSEEWEYDRCEDGPNGESLVVYKWVQCDDGDAGNGTGCTGTGDCTNAGTTPQAPTIGKPTEAADCCGEECEDCSSLPNSITVSATGTYCCDDHVENWSISGVVLNKQILNDGRCAYSDPINWQDVTVCAPDGVDAFIAGVTQKDGLNPGDPCVWVASITGAVGAGVAGELETPDGKGTYSLSNSVTCGPGTGFSYLSATMTVS